MLKSCLKWLTNNPKEQLEAITNGEYPTIVWDATGNRHSMTDAFE